MNEEEGEGLDVGQELLGEGERLAHQACHALTQREVEPLDVVGLTVLLGTGTVLVGGHDALIANVEVGVTQSCLVVERNLIPQRLATECIARTVPPRHHLARSATKRNPDPNFVLFATYEGPHLVQLQGFLRLSAQQRAH